MCENLIDFPEIITLNEFGGNYNEYEEALLNLYEADLWKGGLTFLGLKVVPRVHKRFEVNDKILDWTFAHFTSKGEIEENRELDLRRCEKIGFIKPIIDNIHLDCVKVWENTRLDNKSKPKTSVVIWCECVNCKIVLTKNNGNRGDYYVITTFYLINNPIKIQKHNKEYDEYVSKFGKII